MIVGDSAAPFLNELRRTGDLPECVEIRRAVRVAWVADATTSIRGRGALHSCGGGSAAGLWTKASRIGPCRVGEWESTVDQDSLPLFAHLGSTASGRR